MSAPTMSNHEAVEMMRRCQQELRGLRAECDQLRPRAEAYDVLVAVIGMMPQRHGYGMTATEDLARVLGKRIEELTAKPKAETTNPAPAADDGKTIAAFGDAPKAQRRQTSPDTANGADDGKTIAACGDNGEKWAHAFKRLYPDADEDLMRAWFQNIIEASDTVRRERRARPSASSVQTGP